MTKERLEQIICNVLNWGADHDDEFRECLVDAMDLDRDEMDYFDIDSDYLSFLADEEEDEEDEDDREDAEISQLKYLLNKEHCCPLDKEERYVLTELIEKYGYPEY